jgi:hypothetical protein
MGTKERLIFPSNLCNGYKVVANDNRTFCIFATSECIQIPLTTWVFSCETNALLFHTGQFNPNYYNAPKLLSFTDLSPRSKWFLTLHDEKLH